MGKAHGQRIVAAGSASGTHGKPNAYADKGRTEERRRKRHIRHEREHRADGLKHRIEERERCTCDNGAADEVVA